MFSVDLFALSVKFSSVHFAHCFGAFFCMLMIRNVRALFNPIAVEHVSFFGHLWDDLISMRKVYISPISIEDLDAAPLLNLEKCNVSLDFVYRRRFFFGKIGYLPKSSLTLDYVSKVGCTLVNYPIRI